MSFSNERPGLKGGGEFREDDRQGCLLVSTCACTHAKEREVSPSHRLLFFSSFFKKIISFIDVHVCAFACAI